MTAIDKARAILKTAKKDSKEYAEAEAKYAVKEEKDFIMTEADRAIGWPEDANIVAIENAARTILTADENSFDYICAVRAIDTAYRITDQATDCNADEIDDMVGEIARKINLERAGSARRCLTRIAD